MKAVVAFVKTNICKYVNVLRFVNMVIYFISSNCLASVSLEEAMYVSLEEAMYSWTDEFVFLMQQRFQ